MCINRSGRVVVFAGLLTWFAPGAAALSAPPKVVRTVPEHGDTAVDPDLEEIEVEFDQDMMQGSHSWVGGGPTFPKLRGQPRWTGKRVAVLPVDLEPDHEYWLSINSHTFTNFRSASGTPAQPFEISFRTAPHKGKSGKAGKRKDVKRLTRFNEQAVAELRRLIDEEYSYRDLRGIDWNAEFAKHTPRLKKAKSATGFARRLAKLLRVAKDTHMSVSVDGRSFPVHRRTYAANFNLSTLEKRVPRWQKIGETVFTGRFDDGIGYVLIGSWSHQFERDVEAACRAIDDMAHAKGIIIDVRPNGGGDEMLARRVASRFVHEQRVYAMHVVRSIGAPGGFTKPSKRQIEPIGGKVPYKGKVVVLMGPGNLSSCEAFLLMMKQSPNCVLIGQRSGGSSGNPRETTLANGVVVRVPSWKAMTPDGQCFEGVGIAPDVAVKTQPKDFQQDDPVLEAALQHLRKGPKSR